jgi:hypothetical protein
MLEFTNVPEINRQVRKFLMVSHSPLTQPQDQSYQYGHNMVRYPLHFCDCIIDIRFYLFLAIRFAFKRIYLHPNGGAFGLLHRATL